MYLWMYKLTVIMCHVYLLWFIIETESYVILNDLCSFIGPKTSYIMQV